MQSEDLPELVRHCMDRAFENFRWSYFLKDDMALKRAQNYLDSASRMLDCASGFWRIGENWKAADRIYRRNRKQMARFSERHGYFPESF